MLEKPEISDGTIVTCLHDSFGLHIAQVTFLPLGWVNNAVYHVITESGTPYFLKLRRGNFNEIAVAVPAFLHAQGIRQVDGPCRDDDPRFVGTCAGFDWITLPVFRGQDRL